MKKVVLVILIILFLTLGMLGVYYSFTKDEDLLKVKDVSYLIEENDIIANIKISESSYKTYCIYNEEEVLVKNNICALTVPNNEIKIIIKNEKQEIEYAINPNINKVTDFTLNTSKIYLSLNETKEITVNATSVGNPTLLYTLKSEDENIAKTDGNKIVGVGDGKTNISVSLGEVSKNIEVIVTSLIHLPEYVYRTERESLGCNYYSEEQATLLDEILEYKVNEAGYATRAGVVAAARFLTLEFPYRVPYFYENGRVNDSGVHFADGEGRYYKRGLYLSENKFENIIASWKGPATWGCPLMNLEEETRYGFYPGKMMPNGLDCSGFVSWTLVNGGFDPGDVGAGENEEIYQLTDTGEFTRLTQDIVDSGKIKVGDLLNWWGHIAILIGEDAENYYVAESLPNYYGVVANKYSKDWGLVDEFDFVVFMDDFYKEDGKLTNYWQ